MNIKLTGFDDGDGSQDARKTYARIERRGGVSGLFRLNAHKGQVLTAWWGSEDDLTQASIVNAAWKDVMGGDDIVVHRLVDGSVVEDPHGVARAVWPVSTEFEPHD